MLENGEKDWPARLDQRCRSKTTYRSEMLAREVGLRECKSVGHELYVYPCGHCGYWHLTKQERSAYWSVRNQLAETDDYADILGDPPED